MAKLAMKFILLISVLVLCCGCNVEGTGDSCMVRRMLKAGVAQRKALQYEQRALLATMSEANVADTPVSVLEFVFQSSRAEASSIQHCILQTSEVCKTFSPCLNGGQCQLSLSNTSYVCKCHPDFTGDYCQTPHPAPLDEFRSLQDNVTKLEKLLQDRTLQDKVTKLEKLLQDRTQYLGTGCNLRTLGYKYQSRHSINNDMDEGLIASVTFRKKYANTVLKLSYSGDIRVLVSGGDARWHFKIDGQECARPSKIDIVMYQSSSGGIHVPSLLTGVCESTASNGANLAAGHHTIAVHVGRIPGRGNGNPYTGWLSMSILEIQEMCPQF
ncbi:uncharacterized protein LOC135826756 [Sycon ciliatum]|uniref:uncharacterized protein LOC135826756 n=1 Tax=Sycon ciliatum TaxID=27933 RepID=UPI0031F70376